MKYRYVVRTAGVIRRGAWLDSFEAARDEAQRRGFGVVDDNGNVIWSGEIVDATFETNNEQ